MKKKYITPSMCVTMYEDDILDGPFTPSNRTLTTKYVEEPKKTDEEEEKEELPYWGLGDPDTLIE